MKTKALLAFIVGALIFSCERQPDMTVPNHVIQPEKMTAILADVNIADAMQNISHIRSHYTPEELYKGIYKKHGITRREFDESLKYYTRHNKKSKVIYGQVEEKLKKREDKIRNKKER